MRQLMAVPTQDKIDFRAACFCHKTVVDIGFVCSVCLSSKYSIFESWHLIMTLRSQSSVSQSLYAQLAGMFPYCPPISNLPVVMVDATVITRVTLRRSSVPSQLASDKINVLTSMRLEQNSQ